jgi:hypothetical protein
MRKLFVSIIACIAGTLSMSAVEDNTVEIVFNGNTASVTIANKIHETLLGMDEGVGIRIEHRDIDKDRKRGK